MTTDGYMFGRSTGEVQCVTRQAALVEPETEDLFRRAGITAGMCSQGGRAAQSSPWCCADEPAIWRMSAKTDRKPSPDLDATGMGAE
jgi:hypothetical protein